MKTIRPMRIAAALMLGGAALATAQELPLSFQAFAVDRTQIGAGASAGSLDITIQRWTSSEERAKLRDALTEKGSEALLDALQDAKKAGYIRATGGGLGWSIQYARQEPLPEGGYRVVFATDRPMSFYERRAQPRSADYEFMVAELRIGKDGKGEGKLVPAAKVTFNKGENAIEIENYANEPVELTSVRELRSKDKASEDTSDKDEATTEDDAP